MIGNIYDECIELNSDDEHKYISDSGDSDFEEPATLLDYLSEDESKQIYDNGNRIIYRCLIKYLVEAIQSNEISFSEYNRMVDSERVKHFTDFESNKCDPIILGIRLDNNSKFEIIDGQHRMTLFQNISSLPYKNNILNEYIPLDVRICQSNEDIQKYINSANNRRNFSSEQLRIYKYPLLRDILNTHFKNKLFRLHSPYIIEDFFKKEIFKTKFFEDFNNTADILFQKICNINTFFQNIDDKSKLVPKKDMTKKSNIKLRVKAEQINQFLGLDEKLRWLVLLDNDESEWISVWDSLFNKLK